MVFPEKPFNDFNCAHFLAEDKIITPFHKAARIFQNEKEALKLIKTLNLDADPISIVLNDKYIFIIDWSNHYYTFDKQDFLLIQKTKLDFIPRDIMTIDERILIISDSLISSFKNDSLLSSIKLSGEIQGITEEDDKIQILSSHGVYILSEKDTLKKIQNFCISKFNKNRLVGEHIFQIHNDFNNQIYNAQFKTSIAINWSLENITKVKSYKNCLIILDSTEMLYSYNNNAIENIAIGVKQFTTQDSLLFYLTENELYIYDLISSKQIKKIIVPNFFDLRDISISSNGYLISYSDLSCLFYSLLEKRWYRLNETSGFKGNLYFDKMELICSGDSHIYKYNFVSRKSTKASDLYTFALDSRNRFLFYGSESYLQIDTLLSKLTKKYDPKNETSIDKVEVLDSALVLRFYSNRMIIKTDELDEIIENVSVFNKISNNEILFQKMNQIYLFDVNTNEQILIKETDEIMVSSAKLSDGSILILYNSGNGIRVHTMNKIEVTKISFPSEYSFSSSFCINQQHILFTTWNGELLEYDDSTNTLKSVFLNKYPLFSGTFNKETDLIALSDLQGRIQFLSLKDYHKVFTIYNLNDKEKLIVDSSGRFDGSPGAIDYLYLTCGLEVIDLAQVKDSLWVPGLA
ncbi:MAG: hypothetical protein ACKO7P_09520, partial [Bacteroidota bacterium]